MLRARGGRDGGTAGPWAGSYSVTILYMRAAHPRGSPGTAPGAYNLLQCRPAYCAWSGMVCKGKAVLWAGVVCLHVTKASRSTCPAFLVQVRTSAHRRGGAASHGFRCSVGKRPFAPLFSAAEKVDTEQQLSDLDERVLDELLSDPRFVESLLEQGVKFGEEREEDNVDGGVPNSTVVDHQPPTNSSGLAVAGARVPGGGSSLYESATMQVVEQLQDSVRGLLAKVSAAIESAGIYVANRAQMDAKIVQAVVDYASQQAAAGTGRLMLAATDAASPALMLMGVNTTETQASLNDSLQLLSMGIVPDSVGVSPKILPSLKDFDDDNKRLEAAYRRQRRRRSKPLPAKLLGALPSTINKAADLAYEVEQEVKYERAGNRANKLLKPIGLVLPEARSTKLILGDTPGGSEQKLLATQAADEVSTTATMPPTRDSDADVMDGTVAIRENATMTSGVVQGASMRQQPIPSAPDLFGIFRRFGRKYVNSKDEQASPPGGGVGASTTESRVQPELAEMLAAHPHVLTKQLAVYTQAADDEVRLQERRVRAANAVLCSTESVIAGLEESSKKDVDLLEELKGVASNVQQMYVLAEMTEAVDAAEAHFARMEELTANVVELAAELRIYVATANVRMERLVSMRSRLREALHVGDIVDDIAAADIDFISGNLELLQLLDDERSSRRQEAEAVKQGLDVVWRESAERASDDAGNVHEDALVAACRLWHASAAEGINEQASAIDDIKMKLTNVKESNVDVPTVPETKGLDSTAVSGKNGGMGVVEVAEAEHVRVEKDEPRTVETGSQQARVAQVGGAVSTASTNDDTQVESSQVGGDVATVIAPPDLPPVTAAPQVNAEVVADKMAGNAKDPFVFSTADNDAVDATVVSDATLVSDSVARSLDGRRIRKTGTAREEDPNGALPKESPSISESSIEVVVDDTQPFVDTEVEVEDDVSDPTKVGLKVLDVFALLIEKVLFVGLPAVVSGGALVWERVDNAINGANGRKGWVLLNTLKKDPVGHDDTRE